MSARIFTDIPAGYPALAALAGRDKAFAIFCKFRALNCRNLLYLQSELMTLERKLDAVDTQLATSNPAALLSWPEFAEDDARKCLFDEIRAKLSKYNEELLRYEKIENLSCPTNETVQILKDWLDVDGAIVDDGRNYMSDRELRGTWTRERFKFEREPRELATLDHDDDSSVGRMLRKSFLSYLLIEDVFTYGRGERQKAIWFYPKAMMQRAVTMTSLLLITLQTVLSLVILHTESRQAARLGLIGLFTILVALLLAFCGARKSDIIIGTIGFTAVLVVFVSGTG